MKPEILAIHPQNVYAGTKEVIHMPDGVVTIESVQPGRDKKTPVQEVKKEGNEQRQAGQQESGTNEARITELRREAKRREMEQKEKKKKKVEAFLKSVQERIEKRPPQRLKVDELKGEIRQIQQDAVRLQQQEFGGFGVLKMLWTDIHQYAEPYYAELERRGTNLDRWAKEEGLYARGAKPEPEVTDVFVNSKLSDEQRVEKARKILGMELTPEQERAILKAHYEAKDELGEDRTNAGIYNYTRGQLVRKARILREANFTREEVHALLGAGIAGAVPLDVVAGLDPDSFQDQRLKTIATEIREEAQDADGLDDRTLFRTEDRVQRLVDEERVDRDEALAMLRNLHAWERRIEVSEEEEERLNYGRRPGLGISGERTMGVIPRKEIAKDIDNLVDRFSDRFTQHGILPSTRDLRATRIDYYFNRTFDQANSRARSEFKEALGYAGQREHEDFTGELSILRNHCDEASGKSNAELQEALDQRRGIVVVGGEQVIEFGEDMEAFRKRMKLKLEIIKTLIGKYEIEFDMREKLHNAYLIAETEGEFKDFAGYCKSFASVYADQAFLDAPEVEIAFRVREYELYEIKREHNGYIPPERVTFNPNVEGGSEWERRSRKMTEDIIRKQDLRDLDGTKLVDADWRISRAMSISRGLGMVFLRFPEIVAETHLMSPPDLYQSQPSVPWEKLVWDLNPLDFKFKRYGMGFALRGIFYAPRERKKKGLWNQDEIQAALAWESLDVIGDYEDDPRMSDIRNFFKTGGPFTHTGWRPYAAALDETRDALRPLLARNPGLAMRLIFNRYENFGQSKRRWEVVRDHPDWTQKQKDEFWEQEKKAHEKEDKGTSESTYGSIWATEEVGYWLSSTDRIPHVIFRILQDRANRLLSPAERKALLQRIFRDKKYEDQDYTNAGYGLTIAKEALMKRRADALRAAKERRDQGETVRDEDVWTEEMDQLTDDDFNQIENSTQRDNAIRLRQEMVQWMQEQKKLYDDSKGKQSVYAKILKSVEQGFDFAITSEDVPWSEFAFGQTGPRGFFTRKINDAFSVAEATEELVTLVKYVLPEARGPEQIIEQLGKIYKHVEIYGKEFAQDAIADIATGIIRLYEKDGITKIPIFGTVISLANAVQHRGNSFAQTIYGGRAMDWDSDDVYNFTEQLRMILVDERGFNLIQKMRKETGGQWWQATGKKTKLALYLLGLFGSYEMLQSILSEK